MSHTQAPTSTIVTMTMPSHSSHATAVTTSNIPVGKCCAAFTRSLKRNFSAPLTSYSYRLLAVIFFFLLFISKATLNVTFKNICHVDLTLMVGEREDSYLWELKVNFIWTLLLTSSFIKLYLFYVYLLNKFTDIDQNNRKSKKEAKIWIEEILCTHRLFRKSLRVMKQWEEC